MDEKGQHFPKIDFSGLAKHGAVTRAVLLEAGLSSDQIRHALRTKRLHRIHAGIYAVGRPLTTPLEHANAAVLACGDRVALGGLSALALADLGPWPRIPVVYVARRVRRPGIEIHFTTSLKRTDVHHRQGIRTTTVERALLDATPELPDRVLRRAVNRALRQRATSAAKLAGVVDRNPRHPGVGRLAALLRAAAPTRSPFEDDFLSFCAEYGLPVPETNVCPFGYEVDAWFAAERVIVELDGEAFHQDTFHSDHERDFHHASVGVLTVRLGWRHLATTPAQTANRLAGILAARRSAAA